MAQMFTGSICLTDILEKAKEKHSAFTRAGNGKIYINVVTWLNDEPDKFGHVMGHQLNSSKEKKEAEGKFYIGNSKAVEKAQPAPVTNADIDALPPIDDLPF